VQGHAYVFAGQERPNIDPNQCDPTVDGSDVSVVSGKASGAVWWSGPARDPNSATVTIQLQEYFTGNQWHNEGSAVTATVAESKHVTDALACSGGTVVAAWRTEISATGTTGGTDGFTAAQNIDCRT
jgi:hypothetical protein